MKLKNRVVFLILKLKILNFENDKKIFVDIYSDNIY